MARSGYYPWKRRQLAPLGQRQAENVANTVEIKAVFEEHRG